MQAITCHHCKQAWNFQPPLSRSDDCPHCHRDARVCSNCVHHAPGAPRDCREPLADWVRDKDRGNFCDLFSARPETTPTQTNDEATKAKLAALFKNEATGSKAPKLSLDDLFKK